MTVVAPSGGSCILSLIHLFTGIYSFLGPFETEAMDFYTV